MQANKYISEFIGTFFLVFIGTGSIIVNDLYAGVITHLGISITFGLIVMAMIYSIGDISGAHINPAVTIGFWIVKRLPGSEVPGYVISQLLGAVAASFVLSISFPQHETLGNTLPGIPALGAFLFEVLLTFLLMFVIIHVAVGAKEKGLLAGVAIGATVLIAALFAGPLTGASMNPARSLGPAIISGNLQYLWIYLSAPFLGSLLAVNLCKMMRFEGCCEEDCS